MRQRGWLCSCEILIVSLSNFRRHLSVRSGAKHVPLLENLVKNIACLARVLVAAGHPLLAGDSTEPAENFIRSCTHKICTGDGTPRLLWKSFFRICPSGSL